MSFYSAARLKETTDGELVRWGVFPYFNPPDQLEPLVQAVHAFDKAHLLVLVEGGAIPARIAVLALNALLEMEESGILESRLGTGEGIHSGEAYLLSKLGREAAAYVHLGRSTPDLKGVSVRLAARERLLALLDETVRLRCVLLELAQENTRTIMPSYDRVFQRGEAGSLASELVDTLCSLARAHQRLMELYQRLNTCPPYYMSHLGFHLDSNRLANLLGFEGTTQVVLNWDDVVECLASLCILNRCLSSLAGRLGHWHSPEVGMVELADRYCGTSSVRPQKRNPAGVEFVGGTEGVVIGRLASALALLRGIGAEAYQMGVLELWPALDQTMSAARVMSGMFSTLTLMKDRMRELALQHWGQASYLAALLVRKESLPWRTAHQLVAEVVSQAIAEGKAPEEVGSDMIRDVAMRHIGKRLVLNDQQLRDAFSVSHVDEHERSVKSILDATGAALEGDRNQLASRKEKVGAAERNLEEAVNRFIEEHREYLEEDGERS